MRRFPVSLSVMSVSKVMWEINPHTQHTCICSSSEEHALSAGVWRLRHPRLHHVSCAVHPLHRAGCRAAPGQLFSLCLHCIISYRECFFFFFFLVFLVCLSLFSFQLLGKGEGWRQICSQGKCHHKHKAFRWIHYDVLLKSHPYQSAGFVAVLMFSIQKYHFVITSYCVGKKLNFRCVYFQRFSRFLHEKYNRKVCEDDQGEFLNGWYVLVIVSDLLAIIGSILKMEIQAKVKWLRYSFFIFREEMTVDNHFGFYNLTPGSVSVDFGVWRLKHRHCKDLFILTRLSVLFYTASMLGVYPNVSPYTPSPMRLLFLEEDTAGLLLWRALWKTPDSVSNTLFILTCHSRKSRGVNSEHAEYQSRKTGSLERSTATVLVTS